MDMSSTIIPKSDQLNADDLIAGPITITITGVRANPGAPDQPVSVAFEGDNGKPYKPCKSMRRVMVTAWGPDATQYVGRSMTLYCDPKVAFGGMQVGGIRISHMSHIERDLTMALTVTKAKRAPFSVKKMAAPAAKPAEADRAAAWAAAYVDAVKGAKDIDALVGIVTEKETRLEELRTKRPELHAQCVAAYVAATAALRAALAPAAPAAPADPTDTF